MNQIYFPGRVVDLYAEDYQYLQDSVASESLKFFKSFIAGDLSSAVVKGFTLQIDPSDNTKVYINQNGVTGGVVTASGLLILANINEDGITLSDYTLGTVNSVYAKCTYIYGSYNRRTGAIVENEKKAVDLYDGTLIYNRKIEDLSYVVYTTSEYNALSTSAKSELVYLGSTTAQGAGNPLTSVDISTVSFIYLNIPDHQVDLDNLVLGFKLPQSMVCPTSTGDIVDNLTYPLATPDNLTDDLNIVRTQIRNIKQTVRWDDFQTGAFASDPDTDILHRTGVAPSLYNTYNDFNYTLSDSGTIITIGTGKALIRESKHVELEETSFSIPSSVNSLITAEMHTIGEQTPPPTGVTFTLNVYPLTSSGGVSLQVYSSTGELYTKDIDYAIQDAATGVIRIIPGPSGDIVNENIYCTYYASGYRCDIIACSTTDLVYLEGTPTVNSQTSPPAITSSGLLPLYYIYRNPLVDEVSANDIIDSRIWLEPVKEVRELTTSDLTSYASSTGGYHPTHTNALSNMAFYLVSGDTLEPIGSNWYLTSTGDTEYITMMNTIYMTTYMYTRPNDKVWIIIKPTTTYDYLTLEYETIPGSEILDGSSTIEVPYVSTDTLTFIPVFFDNLNISNGVTKFKLSMASGISISFSTILVGDSDLRYLNSLMDTATANLDAYVNRGGISSTNTFIGLRAFKSNVNGIYNTAIGTDSLVSNITGNSNTAIGFLSLYSNERGSANTALGQQSLQLSISGSFNTAVGLAALQENTLGNSNTAVGMFSLLSNLEASNNTAVGYGSLLWTSTGSSNVAIGYYAGNRNTASNKLFIDNQDRGSQNAELSNSLIVGTFDSVSANQSVTINGSLNVGGSGTFGGLIQGQVLWTSARELADPIYPDFGVGVFGYGSMCALNDTDIVLAPVGIEEKLITYRFNGTTWTTVGSSLNVSSAGITNICSLNGTTIATATGVAKLQAYTFINGTTWTTLGSELALPSPVGYPNICALNDTDIACQIDIQKTLQTYRFNGTTWTTVGSALALTDNVGFGGITTLTDTSIAIGGVLSDTPLQTYRFNGTTWTTVGSSLNVSFGTECDLTSLNTTDIVLCDTFDNKIQPYRFNGTTWTTVGSGLHLSSNISVPSLTALNGTDVVVMAIDKFYTYRFDFSLASPYRWW